MRHRSPKKAGQWREYVKARKEHLEEFPDCQIHSRVCTGVAVCIHHTKGRGIYLAVKELFKSSCNSCNMYLETAAGKKWGYKNKLRLDRIGINEP